MKWTITGYIHEQDLTGMDVQPERDILIYVLEDWIASFPMSVMTALKIYRDWYSYVVHYTDGSERINAKR